MGSLLAKLWPGPGKLEASKSNQNKSDTFSGSGSYKIAAVESSSITGKEEEKISIKNESSSVDSYKSDQQQFTPCQTSSPSLEEEDKICSRLSSSATLTSKSENKAPNLTVLTVEKLPTLEEGSESKSESPISSFQDSMKFDDESSTKISQKSQQQDLPTPPAPTIVQPDLSLNQSESSTQVAVNRDVLIESDVPTIETVLVDDEEHDEANEAAVKIQAAFRGYQVRRTISRESSPRRSNNNSNHNLSEGVLNDNDCQASLATDGEDDINPLPIQSTLTESSLGHEIENSLQRSSSNSSKSSYKSGDSILPAVVQSLEKSNDADNCPGLSELITPEIESESRKDAAADDDEDDDNVDDMESRIISRLRESIEILEEEESSSDSDLPGLNDQAKEEQQS